MDEYDECLIKILAESISDRDREFTGIPLQTRMLAEVFDTEVIISVKVEKNEMGGTCSTYGEERRIQCFGGET